MSNLINEDLFKISQLDYTEFYGKYDMNKTTRPYIPYGIVNLNYL